MIKSKMRNEEGSIIIVAMIIVGLISYFLVTTGITIANVNNRIKTQINEEKATDATFAVTEHLRYELNKYEAGYNLATTCAYGKHEGTTPNDSRCDVFENALELTDEDIKVILEIKGRATPEDEFTGTCSGLGTSACYTIPLPGTGNAGDKCGSYNPTNDTEAMVNNKSRVLPPGSPEGIRQLDYSCNWNKLAFGSGATDRTSIPLYYDDGTEIISPFHQDTPPSDQATEFSIRMRTPCKPCELRTNGCTAGADETICEEGERYKLDDGFYGTGENDIVVQWQVSGECGGEECGLIQVVDYNPDGSIYEDSTHAITESRVNNLFFPYSNIVLSSMNAEGLDTNEYERHLVIDKLELEMEKPILTLFLSEKLIDEDGNNVPYLEYQILTDKPIGSPKTKVHAGVTIGKENYFFEKTLYIEETKSLIDFAIQN